MSQKIWGFIWTGLLCFSLSLGSSSGFAAGKPEEKGGLPQFDVTTLTEQIFWLVILFGVLYLLMSRIALPRLTAVLQTRQGRIASDLERADSLKQEAEKVLAEYTELMAATREQVQEIHATARQDISAHIAARQAAVDAQLSQKTASAEARIQAAVESAQSDLKDVAVMTTRLAVHTLAGIDSPADQARRVVQDVMVKPQ